MRKLSRIKTARIAVRPFCESAYLMCSTRICALTLCPNLHNAWQKEASSLFFGKGARVEILQGFLFVAKQVFV